MSRQEDIERGDRAREVLENPAYREAFAAVEKELIETWKTSRSVDAREDQHRKLELLSKVRMQLEATMISGKIASSKEPTAMAMVTNRVRDLVRTGAR